MPSSLCNLLLLLSFVFKTTHCMIRMRSNVRYLAAKSSKAFLSAVAHDSATWARLCNSGVVVEALNSQGLQFPTDIQSKAYKYIFSGNDTVIGAETGSGKTLAYMLPLVDKFLCHDKAIGLEPLANNIEKYVILSPNQDLCNQIHQMISFLTDYINANTKFQIVIGRSMLERTMESDTSDRIAENPRKLEIIICTPKSLKTSLESPLVKDMHLLSNVNAIVMDEADMLLDGSYITDIQEILNRVKFFRRGLIREGVISNSKRIMQFVLAAATIPTFGVKSIESQVKLLFPQAKYVKSSNLHHHHPLIDQTFVMIKDSDDCRDYNASRVMKYLHWFIKSQIPHYEASDNPKIHEGQLADMSPELPTSNWISTIPFSVMIFFNTAKGAQKFGNEMRSLGYDHLIAEVHGLLTKQQRSENLNKFIKQDAAKVLLCTDACARGLDLPFVKCVVQAEFSLNVVQHLHRVGRASRGGKRGYAINFFSPLQEELVRSIKGNHQEHTSRLPEIICDAAVSDDRAEEDKVAHPKKTSIEESFSRRRGFRRKLRKQEIAIHDKR